jgi:hypothetical protein
VPLTALPAAVTMNSNRNPRNDVLAIDTSWPPEPANPMTAEITAKIKKRIAKRDSTTLLRGLSDVFSRMTGPFRG